MILLTKQKCPECGEGVMSVTPSFDQKIKVVIFNCLFSATFDLWDNLAKMQERLDEAKKIGKLESWGIKRGDEGIRMAHGSAKK